MAETTSHPEPQAELLEAIRNCAVWASRLQSREAGTALQWAQAAHHLAEAYTLLHGEASARPV